MQVQQRSVAYHIIIIMLYAMQRQPSMGRALVLATPQDAVHLMKTAWLQIVVQEQSHATAVLTAMCLEIVAVILSVYVHDVSKSM